MKTNRTQVAAARGTERIGDNGNCSRVLARGVGSSARDGTLPGEGGSRAQRCRAASATQCTSMRARKRLKSAQGNIPVQEGGTRSPEKGHSRQGLEAASRQFRWLPWQFHNRNTGAKAGASAGTTSSRREALSLVDHFPGSESGNSPTSRHNCSLDCTHFKLTRPKGP